MRHGLKAVATLSALLAVGLSARAAGPEDFYKGKSVALVIGYSVGGGYDAYARLLARYMGKYIPGSPTLIAQNMTGAGSLKAALWLYSVAPKDGATFGTFSRSVPIMPLLDKGDFDPTKFSWIGSVTDEVSLCVSRGDSPVKTWKDLLEKDVTFGGLGPGSDPNIFGQFYRNLFGAKIKIVSGYPGTTEATLAMERGEVDGICGLSWSTLMSRHPTWLKEKKINVLVQAGIAPQPELPDVPDAKALAKTPDQIQTLKLLLVGQAMARPFAAPPGIPADRKAALIDGFDRTMKDTEFLAEAKRLKFDVNPVPGPRLDALLAEAFSTPKDVLVRAAKAVAE
jgi:tripartite-type tricarboxylate transporter receptor subunit TctC